MITNNTLNLQIGQAYIVDEKPMVLTDITYGRYSFTDGVYGFGRTLGSRASDSKILNSLKVADVIAQDILDNLKASVQDMANFNQSK